MTKVSSLARLRTIALCVSAPAFALACSFGSVDGDPAFTTDLNEDPGATEQPSNPVDNGEDVNVDPGAGAGLQDPAGPVDNGGAAQDPVNPDDPMFSDTMTPEFDTPLAQEVKGILEQNCAQCHDNGAALGDVGSILSFRSLMDQNKLVPGSKENSSLWGRMDAGTMPPAASTQRPTPGQVALVGEWIDSLQIGIEECEPVNFLTQDELYTMMLNDILQVDVQDREFIRYLGVNYSSNAGECGRDLQRQRYALFKMINSVSTNSRITQPVAIDADELVYRIDIRDYNWDRPMDLEDDGIVDFDDGWQATLAAEGLQNGQYAVEFEGDEADELKRQTGENIPYLPVNAWLQEVTTNDLYYVLIDGRQNINATELDLAIDEQASIDEERFFRAGFSTSGVSKQERAVTRQDIGAYFGNYWLSQDFADNVGNDSLYSDPLDFEFNGGEAIYSLPNGLQAYYATDDDGNRVSEVPANIVIDPAQNNGTVTNAASCHSCHNAGMIPFTDTVRPFVQSNPQLFDAQTFEDVQKEYLPVEEFNRLVEEDSEMHVAAVERAGVPRGTPDPISRVFLQFQLADVTPEAAAGELGVTVEDLQRNITRLDPRLADLGQPNGRVDRNTFSNTFFDSICIMQSFSQNRPANCGQ